MSSTSEISNNPEHNKSNKNSASEVGHAKNVANLQKITQQVSTYSLYNPPVEEISITNLQTLYSNANAKLTEVGDKRSANKNAIVSPTETT